MDVTEENMTPKEMLEKIAELDYSQSQLRGLNAEMRRWLDAADDDMAMLRTENATLRKQVKALEKIISEAQQVEAEPCRSLLAENLDEKRCSEKKIQKLEKECTMTLEQNKKLTAELKSLQQERDQDKISLTKLRAALQTLEKNVRLKHSEETEEECSNIIKDLRLTNQELRKQLEDRLDEASFATVNALMREQEGSLGPPLSFAEEMKLQASSAEVKASMSDPADLRHEQTEAELLKPQSLTVDLQTKRCAGIFEGARVFVLFIFILTVLAIVASGSCAGNFFPINTLWSGVRLTLQPYCSVRYGTLPPI
ncbi:coiled-coil domain-containing protein 14-like isoform X2 [Micropterus salmoides]|uniref:coiled-coil domain-containing protein 14-like isoform X2 n=1 Tax=Micropterus salmoides TaxID=27706 RepID=UPI0018ED33C7|nr:coiled-coil domain-containing protein 14-like isoform X2 [Micropterus salmoides]